MNWRLIAAILFCVLFWVMVTMHCMWWNKRAQLITDYNELKKLCEKCTERPIVDKDGKITWE